MNEPARPREDHRQSYRRRVLVAVPPEGLGAQLTVMRAWLDKHCGPAGWASAPAGTDGVVNDAVALYFADEADARAFVSRFCCGYRAGVQTMPAR